MDRRASSNVKVGQAAAATVLGVFIACAAADSSAPLAATVVPAHTIAPEDVRYTVSCRGVLCSFDASASTDPTGIVKWTWNWGDGTSVERTGPTAKKLFANPGIYTTTLTLTNTSGASASAVKSDTILAEPLGMTKLAESAFDCVGTCGQWSWFDQLYPGAATVLTDSGAPRSPPSAIAQNFMPALVGGSSPGAFGVTLPQRQTIYVAIWMKFSANYQGHGTSVNKVLHFWTKGGRNTAVFSVRGTGSGPLQMGFGVQGLALDYRFPEGFTGTGGTIDPPEGACPVIRDRWHRYEMVLANNTPGIADGSVRYWLDGTECASYTGIGFVGTGQNNKWEDIWWSPTWGGVGGTIFAPFYTAVDHIYVSGK